MCLTGIFPFKLTFRYRESATKIKIWFQKEIICKQMLFLRNFVNNVKLPLSYRFDLIVFLLYP
ncbi:hypothetical protein D2C92_23720 [Salmonella enterica]|nr:hypothetical protein [Salmonella enterica]